MSEQPPITVKTCPCTAHVSPRFLQSVQIISANMQLDHQHAQRLDAPAGH